MPGPVTIVLARQRIDRAAVTAMIERIAEMFHERDFWVSGLPFNHYWGADYPDELAEYACQGLPWPPADMFGLVACCDDDDSHRLLARLTLAVARAGDSLIDCNGLLFPPDATPPLPGTLLLLPDAANKPRHLCDAEFLEAWLRAPGFRMGK
jgi:hypothetical protein